MSRHCGKATFYSLFLQLFLGSNPINDLIHSFFSRQNYHRKKLNIGWNRTLRPLDGFVFVTVKQISKLTLSTKDSFLYVYPKLCLLKLDIIFYSAFEKFGLSVLTLDIILTRRYSEKIGCAWNRTQGLSVVSQRRLSLGHHHGRNLFFITSTPKTSFEQVSFD